ncbi:MAG: pyridoxal phosphate-dependent aminotransferase [Chloroflexota bacterium]|nr:pyridoxal phosphate-dependent aminotransferase [Chloroflexota bacterium]
MSSSTLVSATLNTAGAPGSAHAVLSRRLQALAPSPTISWSARAKTLARQGANILDLTLGEPDFDTFPHVKAAAEQAIRDGKTKYTPAGGVPELKSAIGEKFSRENGVQYQPDEIVVCVGGKQALYNAMLAVCDPGDEVLVPVPTWPTFSEQIAFVGAVPVHVPMAPDHRLRASDLEPYITPRTRAVILNSPSNPTGAVMRPEDVRAVTELAVSRQIYVVSDETYEHFLYDDARHVTPASLGPEAKSWTIEVNTVSKTYAMTGWRIGYLAARPEIVKAVDGLMSQTTSNACSIAQWAAVAALNGPQEGAQEMVGAFAARRRRFIAGLHALGFECAWPEGAFYAYMRVPPREDGSAGDSVAFANRLLEEGHIATVPGHAFFDEGSLRVSYAASQAVLDEALQRLAPFAP